MELERNMDGTEEEYGWNWRGMWMELKMNRDGTE